MRMGIFAFLAILLVGCATPATRKPGDPVPSFRAVAHDGTLVTSDALKGKWAVIWFFPKAHTGG